MYCDIYALDVEKWREETALPFFFFALPAIFLVLNPVYLCLSGHRSFWFACVCHSDAENGVAMISSGRSPSMSEAFEIVL